MEVLVGPMQWFRVMPQCLTTGPWEEMRRLTPLRRVTKSVTTMWNVTGLTFGLVGDARAVLTRARKRKVSMNLLGIVIAYGRRPVSAFRNVDYLDALDPPALRFVNP